MDVRRWFFYFEIFSDGDTSTMCGNITADFQEVGVSEKSKLSRTKEKFRDSNEPNVKEWKIFLNLFNKNKNNKSKQNK